MFIASLGSPVVFAVQTPTMDSGEGLKKLEFIFPWAKVNSVVWFTNSDNGSK